MRIPTYNIQLVLGDELTDRGVEMEMLMWKIEDKRRSMHSGDRWKGFSLLTATCLIECTVEWP